MPTFGSYSIIDFGEFKAKSHYFHLDYNSIGDIGCGYLRESNWEHLKVLFLSTSILTKKTTTSGTWDANI